MFVKVDNDYMRETYPLYFDSPSDVVEVDSSDDFISSAVAVDQFPVQDFNLNDCGWPRNTISAVAKAQTKAEFDMLIQNLQELRKEYNIPKDMSNADAISFVFPRYTQSALEVAEFGERITSYDAKVLEKIAAEQNSVTQSDDAPVSESVSVDSNV